MPRPSRFKRKCARFWESYQKVIFISIGVAALASLYYTLATVGPRRISDDLDSPKTTLPSDESIRAKVLEVNNLEKVYDQAATAQVVSPEALDSLSQAVDKQRELMRLYPEENYTQRARLDELQSKLGAAYALQTNGKIERLQADGNAALKDGRDEAALKLLNEALRIQRDVNSSNAPARYKNYVRETSLAQAASEVEAAPINREKEAALRAAKAAIAEERWNDALAAYVQARDLQGRLNRDFRRSRYADFTAQDNLEKEIASLNSAGLASDVDAKEKEGDAAAKAGRYEQAAKLYGEARERQQEINRQYSRSRFMSSARLDSLEVKQQTVSAQPVFQELTKLDHEISEDLGKRRVVSAEQRIPDAMALLEKISANYPRGEFQLGTLKIRLTYLSLKRLELRSLQDGVFEKLIPLPGVADVLMLKEEVRQDLYQSVMNVNPSRYPGRLFPVDSVNWSDVSEFCTRMGWILGRTVRPPTGDEYRIAIGVTKDGRMVSSDGGQNRPMPINESARPNSNGFYDLLGNLAEWTYQAQDGTTAPVFGGSYLDREAALKTLPSENRPRVDRARHIGFRFVVMPAAADADAR